MHRTLASSLVAVSAAIFTLFEASPANAQTAVARVNCGGATLVAGGATFVADQAYTPGGFGYVGGKTFTTADTRLGPVDNPYEEVVRRARLGFSDYRFDVANGQYLVRLHLAEIELHASAARRFTVALEGQVVVADLDLAQRFGHDYAGILTALVTVADGRLDLAATALAGQSILGGIEVFRVDTALPEPPVALGCSARWSYGANLVRWNRNDAPSVLGYRVEVAPSASGPFTVLDTVWSQPCRYIDLGAQPGAPRYYRVVTLTASGDSAPSAIVTATARDATQSSLPVYRLTVDPLELQQLDTKFAIDDKFDVPATLEYSGASYQVALRYSGFTSADDPKKSFKLRFNQGQTFQDRRELNLKSHFSDDSIVRQEMARRMYLAAGHEAPRATWVHVELNGEYAGVFSDLEVIEEDFLRHREFEQGAVYQAYQNYVSTLYPIQNPGPLAYELAYKKKVDGEQPYTDLIAFIDGLTTVSQSAFRSWIATRLDLDDYLDYLAATSVVADIEKVIRDYHLYLNPDTGRWSVYAWDTDTSWKQNYISYEFGAYNGWVGQNQLTTRCIADPVLHYQFRAKIQALLDGAAAPQVGGPFARLLDDQLLLIGDDVRADYHKYGWDDNTTFDSAVALLRPQAQIRHDAIETQFAAQGANSIPHAVWLDEVMADNATTVVDPAGEYEDWVELVNASKLPFDLGGHHLTDDPASPTKWTFPANTIIAAGEHLVVWCDNDLAQAGLHSNFSLSAKGEAVALFAPGGAVLLDVLHFGPQRTDISLARSQGPAPGAVWLEAYAPTPGAPSVAFEDPSPDLRLVDHSPSTPGPTEVVRFSAHADDSGPVIVELRYRIGAGAFQLAPFVDLGAGYFEVNVGPFPAGATISYWVRAIDIDGNDTSVPFGAPSDLLNFTVVAPVGMGLVVNEVCADNDSVAMDNVGDFEDFVEIRNSGFVAVSLAGHFLTDSLAKPNKWALPAGVVLAPGERLLVWCDNEVAEGPNHASFSLSKDGEEIGIYRLDGGSYTLVDGFAFGPMPTDTSVGSVSDGSPLRVRLLDPSAGLPNEPAPGSWVRYDSTVGAGAPLELNLVGSIGLGAAFSLTAQGPALAPALLAIGFLPAKLELGPGMPLLVDLYGAVVLTSTSSAAGAAAFSFAVPALQGLVGLKVYAQSSVGGMFTSAVALSVGP